MLFLLFLSSVVTLGFQLFQDKIIYLIITKFGMGVYWVNSLHGIAFGEGSSIANRVIATFVYFFCFRAF